MYIVLLNTKQGKFSAGSLVTIQVPNRLERGQKWEFLNDGENPGWLKIKNLETGQYLAVSTGFTTSTKAPNLPTAKGKHLNMKKRKITWNLYLLFLNVKYEVCPYAQYDSKYALPF